MLVFTASYLLSVPPIECRVSRPKDSVSAPSTAFLSSCPRQALWHSSNSPWPPDTNEYAVLQSMVVISVVVCSTRRGSLAESWAATGKSVKKRWKDRRKARNGTEQNRKEKKRERGTGRKERKKAMNWQHGSTFNVSLEYTNHYKKKLPPLYWETVTDAFNAVLPKERPTCHGRPFFTMWMNIWNSNGHFIF